MKRLLNSRSLRCVGEEVFSSALSLGDTKTANDAKISKRRKIAALSARMPNVELTGAARPLCAASSD